MQDPKDKNHTGKQKMIIPIRCKSCGKPVAHLWDDFESRIKKEEIKVVLDSLGLERYCCRAVLMGHIDNITIAAKFKRF